ncbi:MAG: biotin transporter BioY [Elusimicrobiota bacterium]
MLFYSFSLRDMILASLFAALTGLGAFMVIPVYPIPFTLQTLFTYLSAILLGRKIGTLSQIIYILLGIIGLPVFSAGKAGPGVILGPTGGYLWGFIISAYTMGILVEKKNINRIKVLSLSEALVFSLSTFVALFSYIF